MVEMPLFFVDSMSDITITVTPRFNRQCASSGSKWEPKMGYSRGGAVGRL